MKTHHVSIFLIFILSACTASDDVKINYYFKLQNLSSKDIKIISPTKTTEIISGDSLEFYFQSDAEDKRYRFKDIFGGIEIRVIYENEKVKDFLCGNGGVGCSEPRNPLNITSSNGSNHQNREFFFVFTEEDYQNAEECDERCE